MRSEILLPIGELARRTGVNPITLRAWERRYGLLKPQRTAKGHRLYPPEQVERVHAILSWLERGASVGQVRELLERAPKIAPVGDWQLREQAMIEAIASLSHNALDQQFNQAMALYPAFTLCEQLLLPLLDSLEQRWRNYFNARLEQAFFHTWLRSKLGARVAHDSLSLPGPPVLVTTQDEGSFNPHLWLCAWLLGNSAIAVEVFDHSLSAPCLHRAVQALRPRAVILYLGTRIDTRALKAALADIHIPILAGGGTIPLHGQRLVESDVEGLQLFDTPLAALRLLQSL
ncbi:MULTISPECIES: MerR family transcriptional regulator [Pseudomonas]|uniref:HTH-type transcriptional repressor YcgE n=1 Tax=Pseudomonas putida TaxID=303 RepID=A0A1B2FAU0_PSEPU|nr:MULTISPECIES: MerR family transcriptional regulator [Pseudomonas]ANY89372.1 HTH-type transcriptional repressor YcgE [Pseudomonas putida]MCL8307481.1 MerR family transcriptional regulator [Pseudomonas putida]